MVTSTCGMPIHGYQQASCTYGMITGAVGVRRDRDEIAYCILFEVDANSIKTRRNQQELTV